MWTWGGGSANEDDRGVRGDLLVLNLGGLPEAWSPIVGPEPREAILLFAGIGSSWLPTCPEWCMKLLRKDVWVLCGVPGAACSEGGGDCKAALG